MQSYDQNFPHSYVRLLYDCAPLDLGRTLWRRHWQFRRCRVGLRLSFRCYRFRQRPLLHHERTCAKGCLAMWLWQQHRQQSLPCVLHPYFGGCSYWFLLCRWANLWSSLRWFSDYTLVLVDRHGRSSNCGNALKFSRLIRSSFFFWSGGLFPRPLSYLHEFSCWTIFIVQYSVHRDCNWLFRMLLVSMRQNCCCVQESSYRSVSRAKKSMWGNDSHCGI